MRTCHMTAARQQFTVPIACPNCATLGAVVWEESGSRDRMRGPERELVIIHGEFHQETARAPSGDPVIVCNLCDEIQPD